MASSASAKLTDGRCASRSCGGTVPVEGTRPAWTRVTTSVTWAGAAAAAGALVPPVAAAAPAPPACTRLSARLVCVLAAALFLLGCAEAGLALHAMILSPGTAACAPNAEAPSVHTAAGCLVMGVFLQMLAAAMAVGGPAWGAVVWGAVMGALAAWLFPAHGVLWLLVRCGGVLAFGFWFLYVVLWPVAAIGAVVALKWETQDRRRSTGSE